MTTGSIKPSPSPVISQGIHDSLLNPSALVRWLSWLMKTLALFFILTWDIRKGAEE